MSADLIHLVNSLGQPEVLVVGDLMLDRYVWGDAERISQEAPVILLRADKREERLGGASSVAMMLRALGAKVALAGVVGDDHDGGRIRKLLDELGIHHDAVVIDDSRPSTVKERYIGRAQQRHPQQMIRVDYEVRDPLSAESEARLKQSLAGRIRRCDIVLISDYDKGVCTPGVVSHAIATARSLGKRVLVDPIRCGPLACIPITPRVDTGVHASRAGASRATAGVNSRSDSATVHPYVKYRGCSAMTPNRLEASLATGRSVQTGPESLAAADLLRRDYDMEAGIITLDKDGMALVRDAQRTIFPTRPRQVYDITGAGDMVLSVLGIALAAGADYADAIRLANIAGGLEVEKIGVAPVTRDEILRDIQLGMNPDGEARLALISPQRKIVSRDGLHGELESIRRRGQRIAFTNGCFDLLHAGHVQYLFEARSQADLLVVGLNSDASVRTLKGLDRPYNPQSARAEVLAALTAVDYVTIFDELTPLELIQLVRPDVLVKGADYLRQDVVGAEFVESYGGRVHLAALKPGFSTTNLSKSIGLERKQVA
jgi:D-beta-D-heptose 7-phosphate kinase/D-beta-D-heptose 1-phosphate adenosyltransferase